MNCFRATVVSKLGRSWDLLEPGCDVLLRKFAEMWLESEKSKQFSNVCYGRGGR